MQPSALEQAGQVGRLADRRDGPQGPETRGDRDGAPPALPYAPGRSQAAATCLPAQAMPQRTRGEDS
jgi:hypothetical protein